MRTFAAVYLLTQLNSYQERTALFENDAYLRGGNGQGTYFTSPTLHHVLAQLSMVNQRVSAPKMAFVLMKLAEGLTHEAGFKRGRVASEPDGEDAEETYTQLLRVVLQYADKQHWATARSTTASAAAAAKNTWVFIRSDKEVCVCVVLCVCVYECVWLAG